MLSAVNYLRVVTKKKFWRIGICLKKNSYTVQKSFKNSQKWSNHLDEKPSRNENFYINTYASSFSPFWPLTSPVVFSVLSYPWFLPVSHTRYFLYVRKTRNFTGPQVQCIQLPIYVWHTPVKLDLLRHRTPAFLLVVKSTCYHHKLTPSEL